MKIDWAWKFNTHVVYDDKEKSVELEGHFTLKELLDIARNIIDYEHKS